MYSSVTGREYWLLINPRIPVPTDGAAGRNLPPFGHYSLEEGNPSITRLLKLWSSSGHPQTIVQDAGLRYL